MKTDTFLHAIFKKKTNVLSVMTMMLVRIHNSVYDARYNDPILETFARGLFDEVV